MIRHRNKQLAGFIASCVIVSFLSSSLTLPSPCYAQLASPGGSLPWMPKPGVMVHLSPAFVPAHLVGMTIHPENALRFDFLIQRGDEPLSDGQRQEQYSKLVKYFLASLTIPDGDQWVNLSPYEKDRIIKDDFGKTEMGRDLLSQDYILKQITSSLIYPEDNLGKKFWDKVYERAWNEFHTTNIPVNTFNKVWIIPDQAVIYESGNTAYVLRNHLKVMLEQDYLSIKNHTVETPFMASHTSPFMASHTSSFMASLTSTLPSNEPLNVKASQVSSIGSEIIRSIILPELEREVNEGKNFALLRQIYSGMILATWYKRTLKESLLGKVYDNKAKLKGLGPQAGHSSLFVIPAKAGIHNKDSDINIIYQQYLKAFKKGVFNYIKEDVDKYTQQPIPRKYFSGGTEDFAQAEDVKAGYHDRVLLIAQKGELLPKNIDLAAAAGEEPTIDRAAIALDPSRADAAMAANSVKKAFISITERIKEGLLTKGQRQENQEIDQEAATEHIRDLFVLASEIASGHGVKGVNRISVTSEIPKNIGISVKLSNALYGKKIPKKFWRYSMLIDIEMSSIQDDWSKGSFDIERINRRVARVNATLSNIIKAINQSAAMTATEARDIRDLLSNNSYVAKVDLDALAGRQLSDHFNEAKELSQKVFQAVIDLSGSNRKPKKTFIHKLALQVLSTEEKMGRKLTATTELPSVLTEKIKSDERVYLKEYREPKESEQRMVQEAQAGITETLRGWGLKGSVPFAPVRIYLRNVNAFSSALNIVYIPQGLSRERFIEAVVHEQFHSISEGFLPKFLDEGTTHYLTLLVLRNMKMLNEKYFNQQLPVNVRVNAFTSKFINYRQYGPVSAFVTNSTMHKEIVRYPSELIITDYVISSLDKHGLSFNDWLLAYLKGEYRGALKPFFERFGPIFMIDEEARARAGQRLSSSLDLANQPLYIDEHIKMVRLAFEKVKASQAMIAVMPSHENINPAMGQQPFGGIDLNAANMDLQIKRDGRGVPLPLSQQDMAQLGKIDGFVPVILSINAAAGLPIFRELQASLKL